ncbi:bacterioferritin [Marinicella sp. S1101]|uniref:bacterioferritin n=1 Tax=Marinicella marina TaxID=2996016 RepID=UPI002260A656|nr:bacterioferritin [Marinicella marina]MCX7553192.1 bacterioferritin [Marinicella marina]MDJ1138924.1 bacterioferritin [Marinicella marina]
MSLDSNTHKTLNQVLTSKLTSINQFFLHARMAKDWGLDALDATFYKKSIKDMKHADDLMERIFMLGGLPNLQKLDRLHIGENAPEMLTCNETFLNGQHAVIKAAIAECESEQDYVSRDLLSQVLEYEEDIIDWHETQQSLIKDVGLQNYLQSQTGATK